MYFAPRSLLTQILRLPGLRLVKQIFQPNKLRFTSNTSDHLNAEPLRGDYALFPFLYASECWLGKYIIVTFTNLWINTKNTYIYIYIIVTFTNLCINTKIHRHTHIHIYTRNLHINLSHSRHQRKIYNTGAVIKFLDKC